MKVGKSIILASIARANVSLNCSPKAQAHIFPTLKVSSACYIVQDHFLFNPFSADGVPLSISLYNKLRLTGGLYLTEEDRMFIDKNMEEKIFDLEKDACVNYERFR